MWHESPPRTIPRGQRLLAASAPRGTAWATSAADGRAMATAGNDDEAGVDTSFRRFTTGMARRGRATTGVAAASGRGAFSSGLAAGARGNWPCRARSARGGLWTRSASWAGWAAISGEGCAPAVESMRSLGFDVSSSAGAGGFRRLVGQDGRHANLPDVTIGCAISRCRTKHPQDRREPCCHKGPAPHAR